MEGSGLPLAQLWELSWAEQPPTCLCAPQIRRRGLLAQLSWAWLGLTGRTSANSLLLFNVFSGIWIAQIKMEDTSYKSERKTCSNKMHLKGLSAGLNLVRVPRPLLLERAGCSRTVYCRLNLTENEDFCSVSVKNMHSKSCSSVNCLEAFFFLTEYIY